MFFGIIKIHYSCSYKRLSLSSFLRQVSFSNAMSPLSLLAKFSLEKQDCTVKNLAKSVYFLIQKLLRLTIPGYLKDNSVFSYLLSERVVCVVSRFSTT